MNKLFFKRIAAYLIDCFILFLLMLVVNLFLPVSGDVNDLNNQATNLMEELAEGKIDTREFGSKSASLNYDLTKATYISSVAGIVIYILYFVVYQAYNKGQTLGKKWLKLRVVKENDKPVDINTLLIRCLIPYGILVNFLLVVFILFVSKAMYINISNVLSNFHMAIIFITLMFMMIKSKGLHDYLARTKVEEI